MSSQTHTEDDAPTVMDADLEIGRESITTLPGNAALRRNGPQDAADRTRVSSGLHATTGITHATSGTAHIGMHRDPIAQQDPSNALTADATGLRLHNSPSGPTIGQSVTTAIYSGTLPASLRQEPQQDGTGDLALAQVRRTVAPMSGAETAMHKTPAGSFGTSHQSASIGSGSIVPDSRARSGRQGGLVLTGHVANSKSGPQIDRALEAPVRSAETLQSATPSAPPPSGVRSDTGAQSLVTGIERQSNGAASGPSESGRVSVQQGAAYTITKENADLSRAVSPRVRDAIGQARIASAAETGPSRTQDPQGLSAQGLQIAAMHTNGPQSMTTLSMSDPSDLDAVRSLIQGAEPESAFTLETGRLAQTTATTSLRSDLAPHVARQIVEAVHHTPNRPIEIALAPQELGRVRVSIKTDDKSIVVNILAERGETMDLMRRHIDQLGQTFRSIGYENVSFSFGQGASDNRQLTDHGAQSRLGAQEEAEPARAEPASSDVPLQSPLKTASGGVDIRL
ncbi:flagellar hook-length control protein FliK [uncultured Sulfitobacter sp.]|uniref:flagellar hook-length control protein FliK n=1 Tax=uncultured Sulfitobacter sp. TaxID=191468 RepID=UPI00262F3AF2|nr:flagellar hook-length control protein FliK [uncultured Sulfitobacter sp.]